MSSKSTTANHGITLPQGGGALQGMGEKFAPDLHTGTGNFTVPLALPPGRNSFGPQMSLVYSTGNSNGPFGIGWNVSIPGVSRLTSKGIPRYDDAADTFVVSGAEDLVPIAPIQDGPVSYRPRTEGLFARIQHHHTAQHDYWEVRSKDGLTSLYGTPPSTDSGQDWRDPAAITNPADPSHIFAWRLTRTTDVYGNRVDYLYERDAPQTESPHRWDQLYLSQIRYVDYGDPTNPRFLVTVHFVYEERPDPFSEYRAGFEMRTTRRCVRIEISTHTDLDILVRTYHLVYLDQRDLAAEQLPANGVSLLSQIVVEGHDSDTSETQPPLEFGYTSFEPRLRALRPITGPDLPATSLAHPNLDLVDLFGNGLLDILEMDETVRYWRNLGDGRFDRPRAMKEAPAGLRLADSGVELLDANGDGRADLMVTGGTLAGYYPLQFGGLWDRRSFQRYAKAPSFDLKDPEVHLLDLNGDGVTDVLRSGSRLECFFQDSEQGWVQTRQVERQALDVFPNVNFSDPRVKCADMSGDGLQDIVLVTGGSVQYWPNLGFGNWGHRINMRNSPRFTFGYDPRRILLGDLDGDGLADLVYVDDRRVTLWINQGGNQWSEPITISGTPRVSDLDVVRLVDLFGTGVSGLLWGSDADGQGRASMFFLDFTGGIKPYLLNEMDNHMGALTRVDYAPSTRFYLQDEQRAKTRWKTPLPFPVQVVAHVEVVDALSGGKLTTEYAYHHGYWDGVEREFRGFGHVVQRDSKVFEHFNSAGLHADGSFLQVGSQSFSPPTETHTWFHQGPIDDPSGDWAESDYDAEYWPGDTQVLSRPEALIDALKALPRSARRDALRTLRGSILRTELYALDGSEREARPYTVTESLYGVCEESPPGPDEAERQRIFFPHLLAQRTTQWERGDDPMTQFAFTDDYDAYGQPRSQSAIAVPRGRNFLAATSASEPYLATHTVTTYTQRDDDQHYITERVTRSTTYEILNDGSLPVFALQASMLDGSAARRIIGQTINYYDGPAFEGLPFGQIGDSGLLTRTESLVLTDAILREAYKSGATVQTPAELPPYLVPGNVSAWTADYPQEFRDLLPPLAGYMYQPGSDGSEFAQGYFVATARNRYDCQQDPAGKGRGLLTASRDPLGHDTRITYDSYDLLPVAVTDPAGLTTLGVYDYRVLQPREVTDPNGNRAAATFTPLGLLGSLAAMGKPDENVGDTLDAPGTRMVYDFQAFVERGEPVSVRTIKRVHHVNEIDVALPERDAIITTIEYTDGFGRLLQKRTQAEEIVFGDPIFGDAGLAADQSSSVSDAVGLQHSDHVVVSGWQIYDNKGRVVEKYEPFYSLGLDYLAPVDAQLGQKVTMYYDPRGQVIHTVNPDGSEQRIVLGIPGDLTNPEQYTPTPWETYTYDANDNAGRTHPAASIGYQQHWNTPASALVDALGRIVASTVRNGPNPASDRFTVNSTYDIQGNLLTVTDELGRLAFQYTYDLAKHPLRSEQLDAGIRRMVLDAMGTLLEQRDSKGALMLVAFDLLHRPICTWARNGFKQPLTLRTHTSYGDSQDTDLTIPQARVVNLLGKPYQHYDEAGRQVFESYDFKGNVLEKVRRVIGDTAILAVFNPIPANWQIAAFRVNWQPSAGTTLAQLADTILDPTEYRTSATYDGLNRTKSIRYPQDAEGHRKELQPGYNQAGALEHVELDGVTFVEHLAYNANGQRALIAYGNGVMIRYAYDAKTFRLAHVRTEHYTRPDALTYHPSGTSLQDLAYSYDLIGNLLALHDRTPASGIPNTPSGIDALDRIFTYDPLYRLLSATGRECDIPPLAPPWDSTPRGTDITRARGYAEQYRYDPAGNMLQMQHQTIAGDAGRQFALVPNSNHLANVTRDGNVYTYAYDPNGNLLSETDSRHFEWDYADRMHVYRTQIATAEPSVYTHYLYDDADQRVKKLVRKQGGQIEVTVSIDGFFEHQYIVQGTTTQQNNTLHVIDNQDRIALVRVGTAFPDDTTPAVKYHLGDHLGSSNIVVDDTGTLVNREEYTPYGETSFGSFARKRYRFTGKERDEESGLYYHGARYYAPWVARWVSCDPAGMVDGTNLYQHVRGNPLRFSDPTGMQAWYTRIWNAVSSVFTSSSSTPTPTPTPTIGPVQGPPTPPVVRDPSTIDTDLTALEGDAAQELVAIQDDMTRAMTFETKMQIAAQAADNPISAMGGTMAARQAEAMHYRAQMTSALGDAEAKRVAMQAKIDKFELEHDTTIPPPGGNGPYRPAMRSFAQRITRLRGMFRTSVDSQRTVVESPAPATPQPAQDSIPLRQSHPQIGEGYDEADAMWDEIFGGEVRGVMSVPVIEGPIMVPALGPIFVPAPTPALVY